MKISTKGRYALEALLHMAYSAGREPVTIHEVAEQTQISEKYLEQLFFALRKQKIIATVRGPKGGYYIAREFEILTAGEIIRAVEGELAPVPCVKKEAECDFNHLDCCITRNLWRQVLDAVLDVLDSATLADLLESYRQMIQDQKNQTVYYI